MFIGDTLGCFKTRFGIIAIEGWSLRRPRCHGWRPVAWMEGGVCPPHSHPTLCFSVETGASPDPLQSPGFVCVCVCAHLPKNTDPAGPVTRPWAKITFEEGTDHLDDKWASRHCQKVRAGEDY